MAINLGDFKGAFKTGVRGNLYNVNLNIPNLTQGTGASNHNLLVKATQIPASTINPIEVPFMGMQYKIPGDRIFQEWTVTIFNKEDWILRESFENWMQLMKSHSSNEGAIDPSEFMSDSTVTQLDRNSNSLYTYKFIDMWPSEVSTIDLAYDNNDIVEEYTVTFQYQYWLSGKGATVSSS